MVSGCIHPGTVVDPVVAVFGAEAVGSEAVVLPGGGSHELPTYRLAFAV
jgi:hypothetical protein